MGRGAPARGSALPQPALPACRRRGPDRPAASGAAGEVGLGSRGPEQVADQNTKAVTALGCIRPPPHSLPACAAFVQGEVGMSEAQLMQFCLAGGLDDGVTAYDGALLQATERLKQLLLVHGSWAAVADALAEQPAQLTMSWQGLGTLLLGAQRRAWQVVAAMEADDEWQ